MMLENRPSIDDIREAARLLHGRILRTPTVAAPALSEIAGAEVFLKLENLQVTGSFKVRGSFIRMQAMNDAERARGVVAASAGNHAQGVAFHAAQLGVPATIYMPETTPFTKIRRTEDFGATVVLEGETVAESRKSAALFSDAKGLVFVHPYDDPHVIAGQGTVALEMLADVPDLDIIVVPVGGGGLAAGCCIAAKAVNPRIEITGVQAEAYPSMAQAFRGEAPSGKGVTIADGIAVKEPGELTTPILQDLMSGVTVVPENLIERCVQLFLERQRIVTEGSGAVPFAALMQDQERFRGRRVGLVISGGNIDSRILSSILMRGLVREGRMAKLRISLIDVPGTLSKIAGIIGTKGGNIVEVYHQRLFRDVPVKEAEVDIVIETLDAEHVRVIMTALVAAGFGVRLLSDTSLDRD